MSNYLVSIIVPVYNVEQYLVNCLDSIIGQTYRNLEIVLVDDGSLDRSGDICEAYRKKDNRIKVIHQNNQGVSFARINGFNCSSGDFVTFVDSDDYVAFDYIEKLFNAIFDNNADLAGCQQYSVEMGHYTKIVFPFLGFFNKKRLIHFIKNDYLFNRKTWQPGIALQICEKLIKREYVYQALIASMNLEVGEDQIALFHIMNHINSMVIISDCLYYYVKHDNQVTNRYSLSLWSSYLEAQYKYLELDCENLLGDQWAKRTFQNVVLNTICYRMPNVVTTYSGFRKELNIISKHKTWKLLFKENSIKLDLKHNLLFILLRYKLYYVFYVAFYRKFCKSKK